MPDALYDGHAAGELRALLDLPRVELFESVTSTLDVAHTMGAGGAPAGTLILAEHQTAGRGRGGHRWESGSGSGIWLTMVERPTDSAAIDVLSIRLGLHAARVLDRWTDEPVRLKWPNDIFSGGVKLAGILVESRWRDQRVDWVAVGLGINIRPPEGIALAAALRDGVSRVDVLAELVPALRSAAAARGSLSVGEMEAYAERDLARTRRCTAPAAGVVQGIDARGSLIVRTATGDVACRSGSLILEEDV
ncbi:MAG TPA: biotin--[acetyl-CoA-carboxylase] ligase [Gemmatimonadaceae bacterium]